jgi:beta-lactamase regulating signal transducer with metallopeptidase domain
MIIAVIIIRGLFIHTLPKKTFMALWAIVLFRLLIPVSIPSRLSIWNIVDTILPARQKQTVISAAKGPDFPQPLGEVTPVVITDKGKVEKTIAEVFHFAMDESPVKTKGRFPIILLLHITGFCFFAASFLYPHIRHRMFYRTALPLETAFIKQWLLDHPLRRKLSVRQSDQLDSPLTYGIWKPVILLPKIPDWQSESRLSCVLSHEYVHIRRFDIIWKWLLAFALILHWFSPFVWVMYLLANRDIELSCDETVVRISGDKAKSVYAMTLISFAERRSALMSLASNFSKNAVEERIVSIMKIKKRSSAAILAAFIVIGAVALVFATGREAPVIKIGSMLNEMGIFPSYKEKMLFLSEGENTLNVTYDSETWEPYSTSVENETWKWYSYEEFEKHLDHVINDEPETDKICSGAYCSLIETSMLGAERDSEILKQTLIDIENGIKVSKAKIIYVKEGPGHKGDSVGWLHWYCYGFAFRDKSGNEVDLGLYETRSGLFSALKQYCNSELEAGRLTQTEADSFYNSIAHGLRNVDEEPLKEKLDKNIIYSIL